MKVDLDISQELEEGLKGTEFVIYNIYIEHTAIS
jgi:hypothetical protein